MKRRFKHYKSPSNASSAGAEAELTPTQISDAGILEILQAPGAALGSWKVLDALLDVGDTFRFLEPLGRSREVKTALSGLFGRFVARAYAQEYLGLQHFAHITAGDMPIDRLGGAKIERLQPGDLPDWVAGRVEAPLLAIVEAKGSHEPGSKVTGSEGKPDGALARAMKQAARATVHVNGKPADVRHFAIATRWAFAEGDLATIAVERLSHATLGSPSTAAPATSLDSTDEAHTAEGTPEDLNPLEASPSVRAGLGVARLHCASLLRGLGHLRLAQAMEHLAVGKAQSDIDPAEHVRALLERSSYFEVKAALGLDAASPHLVGNWVVRGGPVSLGARFSGIDRERLVALDLKPVLVGIDRRYLEAVISGDLHRLRVRRVLDRLATRGEGPGTPSTGGGGDWIVRSLDIAVDQHGGDQALGAEIDPDL